jgi:uncharacterized protein DUF4136
MRVSTFATAAGVALLGTIALAQNVTYDFDSSADFSRFRRYAWTRGTILNDEFNHTRIVNAVDAQLQAKGLTKVEAGDRPDVLVAYHASFDRDLQITGFASGWGGYHFAGNRTASARTEQIVVGTLAVDVVDATTDAIVWRGVATKDVDVKADPQKRDRNINRAAERLFKNFPPKRK